MMSEQQWCALIVEQLQAQGWTIYQEVEVTGGRPDIVAVRGGVRWSIEVKLSMTLALMDQARNNAKYFHYSSLAVPAVKGGRWPRSWQFAAECAAVWGFGVIELSDRRGFTMRTIERGRLNRRPLSVKLWEQQQQQVAAGSNRGGQWTDFKWTVSQLEQQAKQQPGIKLREAVKSIQHHYGSEPSAIGCLSRYIRTGIITTLALNHGQLYPAP